jgi:hypothetical protein
VNTPLVFISLQSIKFAWGLHIQIIGPTDQHTLKALVVVVGGGVVTY